MQRFNVLAVNHRHGTAKDFVGNGVRLLTDEGYGQLKMLAAALSKRGFIPDAIGYSDEVRAFQSACYVSSRLLRDSLPNPLQISEVPEFGMKYLANGDLDELIRVYTEAHEKVSRSEKPSIADWWQHYPYASKVHETYRSGLAQLANRTAIRLMTHGNIPTNRPIVLLASTHSGTPEFAAPDQFRSQIPELPEAHAVVYYGTMQTDSTSFEILDAQYLNPEEPPREDDLIFRAIYGQLEAPVLT